MTDIDIVAELRRLAETMAQAPLEHAERHFESIDEMVTYFADVASQRPEHLFLHVVQSVDSVDDGGDGIIAITGNGFLSDVHADLFVAVQRYLPELLRMVESLRLYVRHMEQDNPDDPDQWIYLMGRRWEAIEAALAQMEHGLSYD